jgi:hypothetical protein
MSKPFTGRIELDIRDSTPDWTAFLVDKALEGAPNGLVALYDDAGRRLGKVGFEPGEARYVGVGRRMAAALWRD